MKNMAGKRAEGGQRLSLIRIGAFFSLCLALGCSPVGRSATVGGLSDEEVRGAEELKHLAAEDVMLRHACDDGEEVVQVRDYQKKDICSKCGQGIRTDPASFEDGYKVETCSACGEHGIVLDLSPQLKRKRCEEIPPLEQQILAAEQKMGSLEESVSSAQLFALARRSAEDLWQCTAGNESGCRALQQVEQSHTSQPVVIQSPPVVIRQPVAVNPQPLAPSLPGPPVFTNCTNLGSTMNCITH